MADKSHQEGQALLELQEKLDMSNAMMNMFRSQQQRVVINIKRTQLTLEELGSMPDGARMYKPVGKSYFLTPKGQLSQELQKDINGYKEDAKQLSVKEQHTEKTIASTMAEVRELLQSHPEVTAQYKDLVTKAPLTGPKQ